MSFSRSKTKRFNDVTDCNPAVGSYDPKNVDTAAGSVAFEKDDRFKAPKDVFPAPNQFNMSLCSIGTPQKSAQKQQGAIPKIPSVAKGKSKFKQPVQPSADLAKQTELEAEIRKLVSQRNELHKQLIFQEQDLAKMKGRVETAVQERMAVLSTCANLEKQSKDLSNSCEILKTKVLALENARTRRSQSQESGLSDLEIKYASLQLELATSNQEKEDINIKKVAEVKSLQADLEAAQASADALTTSNEALMNSRQETLIQNEELEQETYNLHGLVSDLRHKVCQFKEMENYMETQNKQLSNFNETVVSLTKEVNEMKDEESSLKSVYQSLQEYKNALTDKITSLEATVKDLEQQKLDDAEIIRNLKGEVFVERDYAQQEIDDKDKNIQTIEKLKQELEEKNKCNILLTQDISKQIEEMKNMRECSKENLMELRELKDQLGVVEEISSTLKIHAKELAENLEGSLRCHKSLQEYKDSLLEKVENLELTIKDLTQQKFSYEETIRNLKGEVFAENDYAKQDQESNGEKVQIIEDLIAKLQEYKCIIDSLEAKTSAENERHKNEIDELLMSRNDLEDKLSSAHEEIETLIDQNESVEASLEQQVDFYKSQIECYKLNMANTSKSFTTQLDLVKVERDSLTAANTMKQEKIDGLLDLNDQLSQKLGHQSSSIKELTELKQELARFQEESKQKMRQSKAELLQAQADVAVANDRCVDIQQELEKQITSLEHQSQQTKDEYSRRIIDTQMKLSKAESELARYKSEGEQKFDRKEQEHTKQLGALKTTINALKEKLTDTLSSQDVERLTQQMESWKLKFHELQTKVLPFQEQLDAYEAEKQVLVSQNKDHFSEMDKLGKEYAKLLGHQNQKQKIKYVVKIKDENSQLKQEVGKLLEQNLKQKRSITRLEERLANMEGHTRFDPSKAFQHVKENVMPRSPLRDGNR